jgi:hypothetical protein
MDLEFTYAKYFLPASAVQPENQFNVNIQDTIVNNAQLFTDRP